MFEWKWKFLIVSILIYQAILTWCMFDLIDTASYFARLECGDWCHDKLFGYILTNQGASDTANRFMIASVALIFVNSWIWVAAAFKKKKSDPGV